MARSVVLTGFMGAGKSVVARLAAERLGFGAIDLDEEIERREGRSITAIFEKDGEDRFREIETEVLAEAMRSGPVVVAAGGGILLREENRRLMADALVVNLDLGVETAIARLKGSEGTRPLLRGGESRVRELFEERRSLYATVTDHVDTEGKTPAQVAIEVAALCGKPQKGVK